MAPPLKNLVGLGILVTFASALVTVTFDYDCRRPGSGCKDLQGNNSDALCSKENGSCNCLNTTQGYDCSVKSSTVNETSCKCGVGAICTTSECYCNESSYGSNCENERANLWCNGNEMFINIYPHGDFTGNMFVTMDGNKGGENCSLQNVNNVSLNELNLFKVGTNPIPQLRGFYIHLNHSSETCGNASIANNTSRTSFIRHVAVQYSTVLISSLDQVITFNCTVLNDNSTTATTSIVAGVPSINDYNQINVEEKIEPVTFEVTYKNGSKINQNVTLGAELQLVFNLTQGSLYTAFKVAFCNATNAQSGTNEKSITFLKDDCPTPNSAMLYRGEVIENNNQVIIPINAFKFVGVFDQVAFTCTVNLCTNNVASCQKQPCTVAASGDSQATNTTTTNTNTTNTPTTNTTTTTPTAPLPQGSGRRKRAADVSPTTKDLTNVISVQTGSSQTDTGVSAQNTTAEEDFCMQKMEVIVIIVTFSVALILMIILVLVLVMRLVKSRAKVVDAPNVSGEANRYNLPRFSLATT